MKVTRPSFCPLTHLCLYSFPVSIALPDHLLRFASMSGPQEVSLPGSSGLCVKTLEFSPSSSTLLGQAPIVCQVSSHHPHTHSTSKTSCTPGETTNPPSTGPQMSRWACHLHLCICAANPHPAVRKCSQIDGNDQHLCNGI